MPPLRLCYAQTNRRKQAGRQAGGRTVEQVAGAGERTAPHDENAFSIPRKYAGLGNVYGAVPGAVCFRCFSLSRMRRGALARSLARALQRAPPRHVRLDSGRPGQRARRNEPSLSFCVSLEVSRAHTRCRIARRFERIGRSCFARSFDYMYVQGSSSLSLCGALARLAGSGYELRVADSVPRVPRTGVGDAEREKERARQRTNRRRSVGRMLFVRVVNVCWGSHSRQEVHQPSARTSCASMCTKSRRRRRRMYTRSRKSVVDARDGASMSAVLSHASRRLGSRVRRELMKCASERESAAMLLNVCVSELYECW